MSNSVLLIGSGGHASVLLEILIEQEINVLGYVSPIPAANKKLFTNIHWFTSDDDILSFDKSTVTLVNGIGSLPGNTLRSDIYNKYKKLGFNFLTLVSKNANLSKHVFLAEGVQVMLGAIIQTGTTIGYNTIVNTGAIVDHDCSIGSNNHIAPGVTISGQIISQTNVHFGTGCSVIQSINIGGNAIIGAGVSVTKNINNNAICYPAKNFIKALD